MMVYGLYLRKGMVYIPTKAETPSGSYREIEPVSVVPVSETEDLRAALKECIARGNPPLESYSSTDQSQAVVLKYAGVGSFSSFARGAQPWTIVLKDGVYEIRGQRKRSDRGWEQDPNNIIVFPADSAEDSVIEKMIQILQKSASSSEA
jgi:hypothetical protein